jgi:hypothetical protein
MVVFSSLPYWPGLLLVGLGILGFRFIKKDQWNTYILWGFIFAFGIGTNLQIITGINAEHTFHFRVRLLQPLICAAFLILFIRSLEKLDLYYLKGIKLIGGVFTLLIIILNSYRLIKVGESRVLTHLTNNDSRQMLNWIGNHTPLDSVIASVDYDSIVLLPSVTGRFNYIPLFSRTTASIEEGLRRFSKIQQLLGKDLATSILLLQKPAREHTGKWNTLSFAITGSEILDEKNLNLFKKTWDENSTTKNRLDFVIAKKEDPIKGEKLFQQGDFVLVKLHVIASPESIYGKQSH